jgi:glycosyltransferase involved in cell wall biosynthesis
MAEGKIYLVVSTDLVIDQRVHRTAVTLRETGIKPVLIGRALPGSEKVTDRPYAVKRLRLLFRSGFLFYACFNARLFCFLIFRKIRLLAANDLDTLPACYLVSRIKRVALVFDSHEFFTEVPELIDRRFVRSVWIWIEGKLLPRLRYSYTVSEPISQAYGEKYGTSMAVIRNLPIRYRREARRPDLLDCNPQQVIIYQGTLNLGRGLELMIRAMQYLEKFHFRVIGSGPLQEELVSLCKELGLDDRVEFMGRIPFSELRPHTRQASLGISLEEDMGLNYHHALPNRLFDYIQAQVPVLVSDLPGMRSVVQEYGVGEVLESREPGALAKQVQRMMSDHEQRMRWRKSLRQAASELCWENEAEKLKDVYRRAGLPFPE